MSHELTMVREELQALRDLVAQGRPPDLSPPPMRINSMDPQTALAPRLAELGQ